MKGQTQRRELSTEVRDGTKALASPRQIKGKSVEEKETARIRAEQERRGLIGEVAFQRGRRQWLQPSIDSNCDKTSELSLSASAKDFHISTTEATDETVVNERYEEIVGGLIQSRNQVYDLPCRLKLSQIIDILIDIWEAQ